MGSSSEWNRCLTLPVFPSLLFFSPPLHQVNSLGHLFEELAREHRLDYAPGMFCKSQLPFFAPEHESSANQQTTLVGFRTHEMLSMVIDPSTVTVLHDEFEAALRVLPDFYDPGYAVLWEQFFDRFKTHWVEAAIVGGRLSFSARTVSSEKHEWQQMLEEKLMMLPSQDEGGEALRALAGHAVMDRLTHVGGDGSQLPISLAHLDKAGFAAWLASVRQNPAIVRYRLRSTADLASTPAKRGAMKRAAEAYLEVKHAVWRSEHMARFHSTQGLEHEHTEHLKGQISSLENVGERLAQDIELLEEQLQQAVFCEERKAKSALLLTQCQNERRAYQKSVVECETIGMGLEETELKVQTCELELLQCKLPKREAVEGTEPKKIEGVEKKQDTPLRQQQRERQQGANNANNANNANGEGRAAATDKAEWEKMQEHVVPVGSSKAKDPPPLPPATESSLMPRFMGVVSIVGLAAGIIVCMLKQLSCKHSLKH